MALSFPLSPTLGQTYQSGSSSEYTWNGSYWDISNGLSGTSGTSGANGSQGPIGPQGNDGTSGINGTSGVDGTSGANGINGINGTSGLTINGTSGLDGTSGTSGVRGERYKAASTSSFQLGTSGSIYTSIGLGYSTAQEIILAYDLTNYQITQIQSYDTNTGELTFGNPSIVVGSGTYTNWIVNLAGASGGDGTSGTSGNNGISGTSGINGTSGIDGLTGTSGTSGTRGTSGVNGPQGVQGPQGINGTIGTNGVQGPTGPQGSQGPTGSGAQGSQGAIGAQGNQGPTGAQGNQGASGTSGTTGTSGTSPMGVATTTVNPAYLLAINSTDQSVGQNGAINFQTTNASSGSIINKISNSQVTLTAGNTYRLKAIISRFSSTSTWGTFKWYDVTNATHVGVEGFGEIATSAAGIASSPIATAIVTPSVNTTYELRQLTANTITISGAYASFEIIQINPTVTVNNGTNGAAGTSGAQGPQGNQGPQGVQGVQGSTFNLTSYTGSVAITGSLTVSSATIISSSLVTNTSSLYLTSGSNMYVQNNGLVEITGSLNVTSAATLKGTVLIGTGSALEGGEIDMAYAQTTTLTGSSVAFDVYGDKVRIFEGGGNSRGVSIDLSKAPNGVGGDLLWKTSGLLNTGSFVQMDNVKAGPTRNGAGGSLVGLSVGAVSTTFVADISATYANNTIGGTTATAVTYTTTAANAAFGWGFSQGNHSTYILNDTTNSRVYRIILMAGASFNNNFTSIERLY